jgi:hypothetical protein
MASLISPILSIYGLENIVVYRFITQFLFTSLIVIDEG